MLSPETPFPEIGSYALFIDNNRAPELQEHELVRIQRRWNSHRGGPFFVLVSFPLRDGASGTMVVAEADLIDGTALTREEEREFHELDLALLNRTIRTAKQRLIKARRDALKDRMLAGPVLDRLLRFARAEQRRRAA